MQCLGKEIAFTPLNRLVIPGTHNSGVYSSAFEARTRESHNLSHIVRDEFRIRVEKFITWGIISWDTWMEQMANWAICQELSVSEQLHAGVRYLDFRICEDHAGHLYLCHRVYGVDFLAALDEVRDFLNTHPKEIVIVDIHGVNWSSGKKSTIANALLTKLDSLLFFDKLNEVVSTLWMMDRRVVVLYDGDERFLPRSASFRPWPRCHLGLAGAQSMISFNEKEITANVSPHKLFVNDLECSPTM